MSAKEGFFKIASLYEAQHKQMYLPDSNVLLTRFLSPEGVSEVVDFMPIQDARRGKKVPLQCTSRDDCLDIGGPSRRIPPKIFANRKLAPA
jgi:hypothetical protein